MTDEYQIDTTTVLEKNASAEILALLDIIELGDTSTAPSTSGEFRLDGTDVKVQSGGSTRNLSQIGTAQTSPGGSDTELQYNANGGFGGISDFTYDGTNISSLTALDTTLSLLDQAADPSTNGEIQRNGSDIKAQTGGDTKNLSNINSIAATGSTSLTSGTATVDTGVSSSTTATFMVALGPVTDDAEVAADIKAASGGNYEVDIEETDTSVGNPSVEYDIVRVR